MHLHPDECTFFFSALIEMVASETWCGRETRREVGFLHRNTPHNPLTCFKTKAFCSIGSRLVDEDCLENIPLNAFMNHVEHCCLRHIIINNTSVWLNQWKSLVFCHI
ncbi:hypothetical protein FKM82_013275 [Ascaphus truei]